MVDDNPGIRSALKILLPAHFEQVELIPSPVTLVSAIETFRPDAVLLDMNFKTDINTGNEGLYWTSEIKRKYPKIQVVLFTAYADIALAVEGMKRGAFDFIVKPWNNEKLISTLRAATGSGADSSKPAPEKTHEMYWGTSAPMLQLRRTVEKIAGTDATVLITGENGTGKDVLAREIHLLSNRQEGPMVMVDAGAIPETLFESELFGHVRGAFTDARTDHAGKFEQASGGTLFLDEIGNIPLHLQAKLLRVLQNRTVTRLGSEKPIPFDIRLICATNMDLEQMVAQGRFREDLYYRINTMHLHLPALRQRPDDILPLAELFFKTFAVKYHRDVRGIEPDAAARLKAHSWSGNIRQLQNTVEKAVILSDGPMLKAGDFQLDAHPVVSSDPVRTIDQAEEQAIRSAMTRCGGNLTLVAKELGISRPTLYSKLKKYDI